GPCGRPDGDAVRPESSRPFAHEARGHEGGAPRALRAGARSAGAEGDSDALALLGGKTQAESYKYRTGEAVESPPDSRAAEEVPRLRNGERVRGQPDERQRGEDEAEEDQRAERGPGRELRQEAREEDRHLRVAEVADESLPQGPAARGSFHPRPLRAHRRHQGLQAEKDEVGSAGELDRDECRLGSLQHGRNSGARRERPDSLSGRDANGGEDTVAAAPEQRVPDRQSGVLAGGYDHDGRDAEKGQEVRDHAADSLRPRLKCGFRRGMLAPQCLSLSASPSSPIRRTRG